MKLPLGIVLLVAGASAACSTAGASPAAPSVGAASSTLDASASGDDAAPAPVPSTSDDAAAIPDDDAGSDAALDATVPVVPGQDATIVAFDRTLVCFGAGAYGPCSRTVDAPVTFPATGAYSKIRMHVTLECPPDGCDPWDRVGSIDLVTHAGGAETLLELGRFVTPYGIVSGVNAPPAWDIDVTELRPLLSGTVTLRVFIDTWVPQGNASANGGGWLVGATFQMTGGVPAKVPVAVVPVWAWTTTGKEPTQIVYGDPGQPLSSSLPPQTVTLPSGATSFGVRATITGHGQGNLDNCAEFCSEDHTWQVGGAPNTKTIWRTDCASYPSSGTYQYSRAGWCPGADVVPWDFDVTSQVGPGPTVTLAYGVTPYVNTCNAGAPDGGLCAGCAAGESCAYDGSGHTQPFYYVQSLLIGFR